MYICHMEKWKSIQLFEGKYEVSDMGNVRGWYYGGKKRKEPRLKKPQLNKQTGYYYVILQDGELLKSYTINRLVLTVFKGAKPSTMDARHKDGDKSHNWLSNLKWGTRKQNEADKKRHGRTAVGEKNGLSKVKETEVLEMRRLHKSGESTYSISKIFNCSQQNVWHIVNKKTWRHV